MYDLIVNKLLKLKSKSGLVKKLKVVIVVILKQLYGCVSLHCHRSGMVMLCCDCVGRLTRMLVTFHLLTCWSYPLKCRA